MKNIIVSFASLLIVGAASAANIELVKTTYTRDGSCDLEVEMNIVKKTISTNTVWGGPNCEGGVGYNYVRISDNLYFNNEINSMIRVESENTFSEFRSVMDFYKRTFRAIEPPALVTEDKF